MSRCGCRPAGPGAPTSSRRPGPGSLPPARPPRRPGSRPGRGPGGRCGSSLASAAQARQPRSLEAPWTRRQARPWVLVTEELPLPFPPPRTSDSHNLRDTNEKLLLDPYGRAVAVPPGYDRGAACRPGDDAGTAMKSVVTDPAYDWEGDAPLCRAFSRTVLYELHV